MSRQRICSDRALIRWDGFCGQNAFFVIRYRDFESGSGCQEYHVRTYDIRHTTYVGQSDRASGLRHTPRPIRPVYASAKPPRKPREGSKNLLIHLASSSPLSGPISMYHQLTCSQARLAPPGGPKVGRWEGESEGNKAGRPSSKLLRSDGRISALPGLHDQLSGSERLARPFPSRNAHPRLNTLDTLPQHPSSSRNDALFLAYRPFV